MFDIFFSTLQEYFVYGWQHKVMGDSLGDSSDKW